MAAQEQQRERVVLAWRGIVRVGRRDLPRVRWEQRSGRRFAALTSDVRAEQVGQSSLRDGYEPAARVVGDAAVWPLLRRRQQGLLDGVLRRIELAVPSSKRGEDLRR